MAGAATTKKEAKVPTAPSRSSSRVVKAADGKATKRSMNEDDESDLESEDEKKKKTKKPAAKKAKVDTDAEPKAVKVKAEPKAKKEAAGEKGVGSIVKDIVLKDENGEDVSLAALYEKSGLVIFSYPKANTPGCTNQACGFRDIYDDITATGFQVFGLAEDGSKAHLTWKTSKKLQYSLLSDPKRALLNALGSTVAKKRCHFVIEKGGKLLEAKLGVKPADSPKQALAFIKAL